MILDKIVDATKIRLAQLHATAPLTEVRRMAETLPVTAEFPFKKAVGKSELSFICEVKKASPSKGVIAEDFPFLEIAKSYEKVGADAVSVLTEPDFFKGSSDYLKEISTSIMLPCLRKDFIIDEYQIYEAKTLGASAILLICSILDENQLSEYLQLTHSLGMSALVETHSVDEADVALKSGAEIIGINNRDLTTFNVDISTTKKVAEYIPEDKILVSESGLHSAEDIAAVRSYSADAVLIGEAFMRADNKAELMARFRNMV